MISAIASAPGKINLALLSGPPDASGFHPLTSVFQATNLREYVVARRVLSGSAHEPGTVRVRTRRYAMTPVGFQYNEDATSQFARFDNEGHLAVKAARLLGVPKNEGLTLEVHKTVPVAGGMAGGSADAAATLIALNELWGLQLGESRLLELGAQLGADVPACLTGGLALGLRRGDQMTKIAEGSRMPNRESTWWVAAFFEFGLSTPAVFREFDRLALQQEDKKTAAARRFVPGKEIDPDLLEDLKKTGPLLAGSLINNLQEAAFSLHPELLLVGRAFEEAGAYDWLLSGSGPTIIGLASSRTHADEIAQKIANTPYVASTAIISGPGYEARLEDRLPDWAQTDRSG